MWYIIPETSVKCHIIFLDQNPVTKLGIRELMNSLKILKLLQELITVTEIYTPAKQRKVALTVFFLLY